MIIKAYSIFDTKVGVFGSPFFFAHEGYCLRACRDLASDNEIAIGRHPADYNLFFIGEFDDNTGLLSVVGPVNMGSFVQFVPRTLEISPEA